jgi:hypothetical protein
MCSATPDPLGVALELTLRAPPTAAPPTGIPPKPGLTTRLLPAQGLEVHQPAPTMGIETFNIIKTLGEGAFASVHKVGAAKDARKGSSPCALPQGLAAFVVAC